MKDLKVKIDNSYLNNTLLFELEFTPSEKRTLKRYGFGFLPDSLRARNDRGSKIEKTEKIEVEFITKGTKVSDIKEKERLLSYSYYSPNNRVSADIKELTFKDFLHSLKEYKEYHNDKL